MTHIPYRGTGQSVPALLGGHVQVLFAAYPSLAGAADSKKVKLLAQNGEGRWFQAPDVPAVSELMSNFDLATIVGLFARHGVPQAVIEKIAAEAIAATNSPSAVKQLRAAGIEPAGGNAETLARTLNRELDKVNEVVKNAGIEPQ
jgi:tripartite-type tricarboxylate transporter receptor subunit TctC